MRQAGTSPWPPGQTPSKPWYIDNWSFGEPPSSEAAALEEEKRKKNMVLISVVAVVVIITVTILAIFTLL